jgi:hypothetical protein
MAVAPRAPVLFGSAVKRKIFRGASGVTILALGRTPGKAYARPAWLKWRQAFACRGHRCVDHNRTAIAADLLRRASDSDIF